MIRAGFSLFYGEFRLFPIIQVSKTGNYRLKSTVILTGCRDAKTRFSLCFWYDPQGKWTVPVFMRM